MVSPSNSERNKARLRVAEDVRFVDRSEFCELIISPRSLQRCDIPGAQVRGIYDPKLGLRFLIEEEHLFEVVGSGVNDGIV